jgi:hypothetical protein
VRCRNSSFSLIRWTAAPERSSTTRCSVRSTSSARGSSHHVAAVAARSLHHGAGFVRRKPPRGRCAARVPRHGESTVPSECNRAQAERLDVVGHGARQPLERLCHACSSRISRTGRHQNTRTRSRRKPAAIRSSPSRFQRRASRPGNRSLRAARSMSPWRMRMTATICTVRKSCGASRR